MCCDIGIGACGDVGACGDAGACGDGSCVVTLVLVILVLVLVMRVLVMMVLVVMLALMMMGRGRTGGQSGREASGRWRKRGICCLIRTRHHRVSWGGG